jgi:hypothetical protein
LARGQNNYCSKGLFSPFYTDGTNHVHIDWKRVQSVELGSYNNEGMLTFMDGNEILFRLYKISGQWTKEVKALMGKLL